MIALSGATIIDGTGREPLREGVILIEKDRIAAIGDTSLPIPARAQTIQTRGQFVIPGLMDANVHLSSTVGPCR